METQTQEVVIVVVEETCKNCKEVIEEEDFEECECCNKDCCSNCITHTEEDRYLCDKCL